MVPKMERGKRKEDEMRDGQRRMLLRWETGLGLLLAGTVLGFGTFAGMGYGVGVLTSLG